MEQGPSASFQGSGSESGRSLGVKVKLVSGEVVRLPLGFHFHPTESQLVINYLMPKTLNTQLPNYYIQEIANPFTIEPPELNIGGRGGAVDDDEEYFFSMQSTSLLRNYITSGRRWIHVSTKKVLALNGDQEVEAYRAKYLFLDPDCTFSGWKMYVYSDRPIRFYSKAVVRASRVTWVVIRVFHDQLDASLYFKSIAGDDELEEEEIRDQLDDIEQVGSSNNIVEDPANHSRQADQHSRTNPGDVTPSSSVCNTELVTSDRLGSTETSPARGT